MTTINGYTLFPHDANWGKLPKWGRRWQTGIATGLTGRETRGGFRSLPLQSLTYTINTRSISERGTLNIRVHEALKSGLACVPFFGRGTALAAAATAGDSTVQISDVSTIWEWAVNDYAILLGSDYSIYDAWKVTDVTGDVLTLDGTLANSYPINHAIRPLLFGKFTISSIDILHPHHDATTVTVTQLANERNAQLGTVTPDAGTGVGHQVIESTNVIG